MDNLKKEKQDVRTCSTRYQDNFKTITTKTRVIGTRKDHWAREKNPETDPHIYGHLVL